MCWLLEACLTLREFKTQCREGEGVISSLSCAKDTSPGYTFANWSGDLTGSTNPDTITMDGNKSVTATFTEVTISGAYSIKSETIAKLEGAKDGSKIINRRIDRIIKLINSSLKEKYWIDESRLDAKCGKTVFHKETLAAISLQTRIKIFNKTIPILEKIIIWKEKKGRDTTREETKLAAIEKALPVFREVIGDLVTVDRLLAEVAIEDAEDTGVQNPKFERIVDLQIKRAKKELGKAEQVLEDGRAGKAISHFGKAWRHAQLAIKFANRA